MTESFDIGEDENPALAFSFAGAKLAPSEAVLLYGNRFSTPLRPARFGREKLLRTHCIVSAAELSRAIWMAALLSLEAMRCIRFEIGQKPSPLLGKEKACLYVAPLPSSFNLPLGCLETRICRTLGQGRWQPDRLVYRLLEQEGGQSRFNTLRLVKDGLLDRGLVTIRVCRRLGLLRFADYRLVRRTLTMIPDGGLEDLSGLLNGTEKVRAALLAELRDQIGKGLARARYIRAKRTAELSAELAHGILGLFR